jgi:hypothetical protein
MLRAYGEMSARESNATFAVYATTARFQSLLERGILDLLAMNECMASTVSHCAAAVVNRCVENPGVFISKEPESYIG